MQTLEFIIPTTGKRVKVKKFALDLKLRFSDRFFIGRDMNTLPFYVHVCSQHGYQVDYPHGYEERLDCEVCQFNKLIEIRLSMEKDKREQY